jgi:hypothetical protein
VPARGAAAVGVPRVDRAPDQGVLITAVHCVALDRGRERKHIRLVASQRVTTWLAGL